MSFSPVPAQVKPVAHLMKLAAEHDSRNIVVAYWARMAACHLALKIVPGKKSPEVTNLVSEILNWLEKTKSENRGNDGICNETAGQAIIEEYALNLFSHAEKQDAAEIFNKNTVKTFYTAGMLFDVLEQFGLSEDLHEKQKYAKWKAAYIHNCLKFGEKPVPGPPTTGDEGMIHISELPEEEQMRLLEEKEKRLQEEREKNRQQEDDDLKKLSNFGNVTPGTAGFNDAPIFPPVSPASPSIPVQPGTVTPVAPNPQPTPYNLPPQPQPTAYSLPPMANYNTPSGTQISLTPEQIQKAQKYSKYATSALNYDDVKTAVENLQKALNLLQFGKE
ncbi:unnamed protein product [Ceutorhynchus assimilis]|uniref:Vacuolar protein sorting-associated protein VTA1 n=1 Tax=Ceutorhynchus assimilis TaxID=467358 RepID=A0A9N9MNC3_9CUCU|nr:unnamed protein product [Ceutorhynchus assimilis]